MCAKLLSVYEEHFEGKEGSQDEDGEEVEATPPLFYQTIAELQSAMNVALLNVGEKLGDKIDES